MRRLPSKHLTVRLGVELMEDRCNPSTAYIATDLVANLPGIAPFTDPTLVNAWGIALNPNGPFWISSNGADLSEVYRPTTPLSTAFTVNIPGGAPTGQAFNSDSAAFHLANGKAAAFIFTSEAGLVTAWNPADGTTNGAANTAETTFTSPDGAIYKGIAEASDGTNSFLYLADFHNGKIDVLDSNFGQVELGTNGFGDFTDSKLPNGYAPFNVAAIDGKLYVSYAKQDADAEDDVAGHGHGFVDVFDLKGNFEQRLISRGDLNSPWAMVKAPNDFGDFGGDLLVGNFGDGRIHAYDINTGRELGTLSERPGKPIVIDGLWGLSFGNAKTPGGPNTLFYAAGPDGETNGLFGKITANAAGTNPVTAELSGSDLIITGSRNGDRVGVFLSHHGSEIDVVAGGKRIGQFDSADVATIQFNGLAGNDSLLVSPRITATVIADGGAGNDSLFGGGGSNILLGNTGNDFLVGGNSRDILIGGEGHDSILGLRGDDIVIGGTTDHDADQAALLDLLNAWNDTASYNDRIDAIRAGNGSPILDTTTVHDDGDRDFINGGFGLDWFFGDPPDRFFGRGGNEQTN